MSQKLWAEPKLAADRAERQFGSAHSLGINLSIVSFLFLYDPINSTPRRKKPTRPSAGKGGVQDKKSIKKPISNGSLILHRLSFSGTGAASLNHTTYHAIVIYPITSLSAQLLHFRFICTRIRSNRMRSSSKLMSFINLCPST